MTYIILRDDDANATTDPERFARAYAPLLDAGLPIALSVIPDVALDTRAPDGSREAFLDAAVPPSSATIELTKDAPITRFIAEHADQLDVLQHGTTHQRVRANTEYGALTYEEACERIDRGRRILAAAFGRAPTGFVAPWDRLSRGSIAAVVERFQLLSTHWVALGMLPRAAWPAHVVERLRNAETLRVGRCRVVRHRGGRISGSTPPARVPAALDALTDRADVAVVVLHHWMFWGDREPHPAVVALAAALRRRGGVLRARDLPRLLERSAPVFTADEVTT